MGQSEVDGDRELVHGSSTVFVLEEELPPPAFTRSIVAKFRELESTGGDKTVPLPGKVTPTSKSTRGQTDKRSIRSTSGPVTEDEFIAGIQSDGVAERGRSQRRSEDRQREVSGSPRRSFVDELPQEGTARSLLARWRTIEQQANDISILIVIFA